jgi:hypothetical protein
MKIIAAVLDRVGVRGPFGDSRHVMSVGQPTPTTLWAPTGILKRDVTPHGWRAGHERERYRL